MHCLPSLLLTSYLSQGWLDSESTYRLTVEKAKEAAEKNKDDDFL